MLRVAGESRSCLTGTHHKTEHTGVRISATLLLVATALMGGCPGELSDPARFESGARVCRIENFNIETFMETKCASSACHGHPEPDLISGGLDLRGTSDELEARLLGRSAIAGGCTDRVLLSVEDVNYSYLLEKMESTDPQCGEVMPLLADPLSRNEINCVQAWLYKIANETEIGNPQ